MAIDIRTLTEADIGRPVTGRATTIALGHRVYTGTLQKWSLSMLFIQRRYGKTVTLYPNDCEFTDLAALSDDDDA